MKAPLTLRDRIDQAVFDAIYARSLVYNTCWEDPAVDRLALDIRPDDTLLVITSAGCNVLDYALTAPRHIHAVDANPRQTALLELKLAGIRRLAFDDFFALFGTGVHDDFRAIYRDALRADLSPFARAFWDERQQWFSRREGSFYFQGLAGTVARAFHAYLKVRPRLAATVTDLFQARSLEQQREVYDTRVQSLLWGPGMNWTLSRQLTMSMLGVPYAQRRQVQAQHHHGVAGFVREAVEYVFRQLPIWTNYFGTVYVHGRYSPECCPEYQVTKYHRWIAVLGDHAYGVLVRINGLLSWLRRRLGVSGYWSLSGYAKRKVKSAVSFIFDFEESVARCAKARGVDGVICGHIHAAAIKELDGIRYLNCGGWVDSCTAIVEHSDGRMELIEWGVQRPALPVTVTGSAEGLGEPWPERALAARELGHGGDAGATPGRLPLPLRWRAFAAARPRRSARRRLP